MGCTQVQNKKWGYGSSKYQECAKKYTNSPTQINGGANINKKVRGEKNVQTQFIWNKKKKGTLIWTIAPLLFTSPTTPFLPSLEPPRFRQQVSLPQVPRLARHAAVDTSPYWKHRRREPNSLNCPPSRFSPAREVGRIPESCRCTPRRSDLAFASSDRHGLDCRHDAIAACRVPLPLLVSKWLT